MIHAQQNLVEQEITIIRAPPLIKYHSSVSPSGIQGKGYNILLLLTVTLILREDFQHDKAHSKNSHKKSMCIKMGGGLISICRELYTPIFRTSKYVYGFRCEVTRLGPPEFATMR